MHTTRHLRTKYIDEDCLIRVTKYMTGQTALIIESADGSEMLATATVCLPGMYQAEDTVLIKDYSENEGMADALVEAGIITRTGGSVCSGFVTLPVCQLNYDAFVEGVIR